MQEDQGLIPGSGRSPRERNGYPTPVFLPGKSQGQRTLASYSPWGPRVGHNFHFHEQSYCKHLCAGFVWTGIESWSPDCRRILYRLSHQGSQVSINKLDNQLNLKNKKNSPVMLSSTKEINKGLSRKNNSTVLLWIKCTKMTLKFLN